MAVGANPFELPEEKGEPRAPLEGVVAEGQQAAGTRPTCPGCGGRVMQVVGLGGQLRWVCQLEGGTVTPCWIPDMLSTRSPSSTRFEAPVTAPDTSRAAYASRTSRWYGGRPNRPLGPRPVTWIRPPSPPVRRDLPLYRRTVPLRLRPPTASRWPPPGQGGCAGCAGESDGSSLQ
jgi:hypothetical protein